tara:strand:+ start:879 stop:1250 length:372 start_codon:yes stop_codon:yes gene_type:complete
MKKLIQKIEKAIEPRMEEKGYGDNPTELVEERYGYIYLTPVEVLKSIKMRRCEDVLLSTSLGGYTNESIENNTFFPHANSFWIDLTKKQAKEMIDLDSNYLIKVRVSASWRDGSDKFRMMLCG